MFGGLSVLIASTPILDPHRFAPPRTKDRHLLQTVYHVSYDPRTTELFGQLIRRTTDPNGQLHPRTTEPERGSNIVSDQTDQNRALLGTALLAYTLLVPLRLAYDLLVPLPLAYN